jgi:hypothetical protein
MRRMRTSIATLRHKYPYYNEFDMVHSSSSLSVLCRKSEGKNRDDCVFMFGGKQG